MKNKIIIGYTRRDYPFFTHIDFGLINDAVGTIEVEKHFWIEYCKKRMDFEIMHSKLIDKIKSNNGEVGYEF